VTSVSLSAVFREKGIVGGSSVIVFSTFSLIAPESISSTDLMFSSTSVDESSLEARGSLCKFKSPRASLSREIFSDSNGKVGASSPGFLWSLFILGAEGLRMVTKHLLSVF